MFNKLCDWTILFQVGFEIWRMSKCVVGLREPVLIVASKMILWSIAVMKSVINAPIKSPSFWIKKKEKLAVEKNTGLVKLPMFHQKLNWVYGSTSNYLWPDKYFNPSERWFLHADGCAINLVYYKYNFYYNINSFRTFQKLENAWDKKQWNRWYHCLGVISYFSGRANQIIIFYTSAWILMATLSENILILLKYVCTS